MNHSGPALLQEIHFAVIDMHTVGCNRLGAQSAEIGQSLDDPPAVPAQALLQVHPSFGGMNAWLRLRRVAFRAYVHPVGEMLDAARSHGFQPADRTAGAVWESVILRRPDPDGAASATRAR